MCSQAAIFAWWHGFSAVDVAMMRFHVEVLPRPKGSLLDSDLMTQEVTEVHICHADGLGSRNDSCYVTWRVMILVLAITRGVNCGQCM